MVGAGYRFRFLAPTALMSLLLLALAAFAAVSLYRQSAVSVENWSENNSSRQAADNLAVALVDLMLLLRDRSEGVEPLHARIGPLLARIEELADKDRERDLAHELAASFAHYRKIWGESQRRSVAGAGAARLEAQKILETETLPSCQRLRDYNAAQIDESERAYRDVLAWMAWWLAVIGTFGSVAGLLLGYSVARWLSRSIYQLRVRVQDAAGKLGQDLPSVVLTEKGDLERLHEELQAFVRQVEQVVRRLHEREHELLRSEQLAAVGQMAAGLAHELRNPLTSVKMLVQAQREEAAAKSELAQDLGIIDEEIRRMERLLRTFLEFARPPRLRPQPVELAEVVAGAVDLVRARAAKQRVALVFDRPATVVRADADREQLHQVLVNLLLNALDVMPTEGTLTIVLQSPAAGGAEIHVLDSGPGISAEQAPKMFIPFSSTKETGVGLGLVVSRRIVEDHGGTLIGENRPEGGAKFVVRLPPAPARTTVAAV